MKTCTNCNHFEICDIIKSLKAALKRFIKIFIPSGEDKRSPSEKLYEMVAEGCKLYTDETNN